MNTIKELYEELRNLLKKHPEINDLNIDACGAPGSLFIYRDEPDGAITGISYEDDSFLSENENNAKEWLKELEINPLPSQYMNYLVQMCMQGVTNEDIKEFIKEYSDKTPAGTSHCKGPQKEFHLRAERKIVLTAEDIDQIMCSSLEGGETARWCTAVVPVGEFLGEFEHEQIARGGKLKFYEVEEQTWHELSSDNFILWYESSNDKQSLDLPDICSFIPAEKKKKALICLIDNNIPSSNAEDVLQELGLILLKHNCIFLSKNDTTAMPAPISKQQIMDAESCLTKHGIDKEEANTVLQALGYILMDKELYPNFHF